MLGVIFDIDSIDEGEFIFLFSAQKDNAWRWNRILQIARRANSKGQILQSNGTPISARMLGIMHRDPDGVEAGVNAMEAFLATAIEVGLLVFENGVYRIVDWARWHKPKSHQAEGSADRKAEQRERDRLRAENDKLKAALEQALSGNMPSSESQPVTTCHKVSQQVTIPPPDVTSVTTHTRTLTLTHTDQENAACNVQSRESTQNQGSEGGYASRSLMAAGFPTVSVEANRLIEAIRERHPTFTPKVQEADNLVREMFDLCKRKANPDDPNGDFFSQADFELGLSLAARQAEGLDLAGRGPMKLLAWILEVARRKYFKEAHVWRKQNEKRAAKGKPPIPPLEPDLSELERRR